MSATPVEILSAQQDLLPHVAQFNALTQKIDTAVKSKNAEAVLAAKQELDVFFGQLQDAQQQEIRIFVAQQKVGQTIQRYRAANRGHIHAMMDTVVGISRTMADTVPKVAEETLRLIVSTIGHLGVGLVRGVLDANKSAKQAA